MIDWAYPFVFAILPLPLLVHWLVPAYQQSDAALRVPFFRRLAEAAEVAPKAGAAVVVRPKIAQVGGGMVWLFLILALAGPEQLGPPTEISRAKRDVVLAIDLSGSMDTVDFPTSDGQKQQRFAVVQDVVHQFVQNRDGDRVALIVFGSKAYVQAPLTEDLSTVSALLAQSEVGMAGPHTALGDAIGLAIRTFEASEIDQRLLILLSDGNDTASRMSPINAAEIARGKDVQIYAVGVGDPDATGEHRLDMSLLHDLARHTGGQAYFAGDGAALEDIYQEIDALTPRDVETLSWRTRTSLSHWGLLAALLVGMATTLLLQGGIGRERRA